MRFTPSFLEEIRDRIPIADVVGRRVSFDAKKSNPSKGDYWACCPFHGEKSPSFHCENQKGRYHCFGCGVSGDHFKFLTELDGLSFPEAVERLADEAGIALPAPDPQAAAKEKVRASLYDVMEMATAFFRAQLHEAGGAPARAYLRDRGLSASVQETFGLGYAPGSRSALKEYLGSKGVEKHQIEACGLVVFGPDIPVSYDRFRDRIMFPIHDPRGRVIAFGGRALSADIPAKYLNSPETDLFSKSNVLYNYARARKAVARGGNVIVAEGYMDVIALHAAGFENAVAPLGTALTDRQLELAWKVGGEPVLCFDGDEAGVRAAGRSIDTALPTLRPGRSLRFALLPEGEDPDDLLKRGGREAFATVLQAARPLADMLWQRETGNGVFDTPERRAELEGTLRRIVRLIGDEGVQRHYDQTMRERLAQFFGSSSGKRSFNGQNRSPQRGAPGQSRLAISDALMNSSLVTSRTSLPPLRDTTLVATVLNHPEIGVAEFDELAALDFHHPVLKALHRALLDILASALDKGGDAPTVESLRSALSARGLDAEYALTTSHVRHNRVWQAMEGAAFEDAEEGWKQACALRARSGELTAELRAAQEAFEAVGDEHAWDRIVSLKREMEREVGLDALIEGFGAPSGRPARSF